jgi:Domain of unknown function (DUF4139)/N-terminal domain of unknown function (DUF4140)
MKKYFLFLILSAVSLAQLKPVESKVIEATVFKDRAMVTRSADVNLLKDENTIIFSELTTDIKDESVRISAIGNGEIKILDVKVERKFTTEIRKESSNELQKKIDALKSEMLIASDQIAIYDSKKLFIESLKAESVKYANQKILSSTNSTKEWNDILSFVDKNLKEIYSGIREQAAKRSKLEEEIKTIQLTMNQSKDIEQKNYKEIIVKINASQNTKAEIQASYIVNSASWFPIYDARVDSKSKQVELDFFGMVHQSTGEDWKDIKLTFSTADPLSVKSLPKLDPWFVDVAPLPYNNNIYIRGGRSDETEVQVGGYSATYDQNFGLPKGMGAITGYVTDAATGEPLIGANVVINGTSTGSATDINGKYYIPNINVGTYNIQYSYIGYNRTNINIGIKEKHVTNLNVPLTTSELKVDEVVVVSEYPVVHKSNNTVSLQSGVVQEDNIPIYSDVKAKDISTTFVINTKNTIPSDNSTHKVTIAINNLPIDFSYTSIPKILPKVYVKGKAANKNDYPLLEGEINIFVDNDFVNRTFLNTIVPTDTLELALGIDESIKCEKILKNKFVEAKGLFDGSKMITYDYEIKITNNRKTAEDIAVLDQLPITRNEKIKIELLIPKDLEEKLNDKKELKWDLKLNAGETRIIPLKFTVEFPNSISVYGLE